MAQSVNRAGKGAPTAPKTGTTTRTCERKSFQAGAHHVDAPSRIYSQMTKAGQGPTCSHATITPSYGADVYFAKKGATTARPGDAAWQLNVAGTKSPIRRYDYLGYHYWTGRAVQFLPHGQGRTYCAPGSVYLTTSGPSRRIWDHLAYAKIITPVCRAETYGADTGEPTARPDSITRQLDGATN